MPLASVTAVTGSAPPANVPLGPDAGAVKVTVIPLIGLPELSSTSTDNGVGKVVPTIALWDAPCVGVSTDGTATLTETPARSPTSLAVTGLPSPVTRSYPAAAAYR